jgi:hypothetical protein
MARRFPLSALAAAVLLGACTPEAPAEPSAAAVAATVRLVSPSEFVQTFYVKEPAWGTAAERRALFEPELAEALIADSSDPGEVGIIDFSIFCGCQDGKIKDVTTTDRAIPGGAEVTARFTLEGRPRVIVYKLMTTRTGYKIADVSAPVQNGQAAWSLRGLLGLNQTA